MLYVLVVFLIVGSAAVMMNEGIYSAAVILICTVLGGLIAFTTFEPAAGLLERTVGLAGYTDIIALLGIFAISVTVLREITERLAPVMVEFPGMVHRGGGFLVGAWIGWILSGILLCALQTLPLHQNFLGYDYRNFSKGNAWNADRYWLAFVHRVSRTTLATAPPRVFDPQADFAIRYHRYRRRSDTGETARMVSATAPASGGDQAGRGRRRHTGGGRRGH